MKAKWLLLIGDIVLVISSIALAGSDELPPEAFYSGKVTDEKEFQQELDAAVQTNQDENIMLFGSTLDIKGEAKDLIMAVGQEVTSKALGSYAFIAASKLDISGEIFRDTFAVGNTVDVTGNIGRDFFGLGNVVNITGTVNRDVYAGGEEINIIGTILGDVKFAGGKVFIGADAVIDGDLDVSAEIIEIRSGATINGTVIYPSNASQVEIPNGFQTRIREVQEREPIVKNQWRATLEDFLYWSIANTILALILMAIFKRPVEGITELFKEEQVKTCVSALGIGILVLIVLPIISMLALFTIIGSMIGIIGFLVYTLLFMTSSSISAYVFSILLFENAKMSHYAKVICGVLAIELLKRLPIIGGLISFVLVCVAFGIIVKYIMQSNHMEIEEKKIEE